MLFCQSLPYLVMYEFFFYLQYTSLFCILRSFSHLNNVDFYICGIFCRFYISFVSTYLNVIKYDIVFLKGLVRLDSTYMKIVSKDRTYIVKTSDSNIKTSL
jgi:hypothetical protein